MKDIITIRPAKNKDISRISYITKISYRSPFILEGIVTKPHDNINLLNDFLDKKIFIVVAEINKKIVGAVRYHKLDKNKIYIFQLVVLKTYRGLKIGEMLINKVEEVAVGEKVRKVTLDCMQEKHLDKYYKTLGYKVDDIKRVKDYHMVYMSKKMNEKI